MSNHDIGDAAWLESTTAPIAWSSGRWSLELRDDELADIRFDGTVVLRSIRGVARDRDWGTIAPVVTAVSSSGDLVVEVSLVGRDADLAARLVVSAADGALDVRWDCDVHAPFLRNRLGLVVLHPPTLAGAALRITHPSGAIEATAFPDAISPHQPAFDIRALGWEHGGVSTSLEFEGDVFEMEDQRNWTDASFKTYSTPLAVPFPVLVDAGTTVSQGIRIGCSASEVHRADVAPDRIELVPAGRSMPAVSTSMSTGGTTGAPIGSSLLVELPAHTPVWREVLDRAVTEAAGLPLDVRIIAPSVAVLDEVLDALETLDLVRVGAFSPETHVSEPDLWAALSARDLPRIGGTRAHFTELNRTLDRLPDGIPAYTFSITPEMHAVGREQLVESIAMQRLVARNAVRMTGAPVHVGPVTLRARFNAVATGPVPSAGVTDLTAGYGAAVDPDTTDARQQAPALLAWTIASAAALSVEGVESISWFEASGPRGVASYPVATALEWLAELAGGRLLESTDAPDGLWALGADDVALIANLRDEVATVTVAALGAERIVVLEPFAAARLRIR